MKCLLVLSVIFAACAASAIFKPSEGDENTFIPINNDVTLDLKDNVEPMDSSERNAEENEYILYTRANPTTGQRLIFLDGESVIRSHFGPRKTVVVLIHGHNGNGEDTMSTSLREAFLANGDVNVIVVDWRRLANRNYITAKNGVPAMGRHVGKMINWLVSSFGALYERMHFVGFNLGAHVAGNAGRETKSLVRRITALEPSGALWSRDSERLTPDDGQYVEAIHTNTEYIGISDESGHADFYPNGGGSQPGCWTNSCSHNRVVELMHASIMYNHLIASQCENRREAARNRCTGFLYPMGNADLNKSRPGIYRLNTGRNYPFA